MPKRKTVLAEELYVANLNDIIKHNYFPNNNGFDDTDTPPPLPLPLKSLTNFHNNFISEDNEYFATLHEQDLKAHREKFAYAYTITNGGVGEDASFAPLPPPNKQSSALTKMITEEAESADQCKVLLLENRDTKRAQKVIENAENSSKVLLLTSSMPPPAPKLPNQHQQHQQQQQQQLEPFIQAKNTRLQLLKRKAHALTAESLNHLNYNRGADNLYERSHTTSEYGSRSRTSSNLSNLTDDNNNHRSFVQMTPLIIPGGQGDENDSPLMTWGEVDMTPIVLSKSAQAQGVSGSPMFEMKNERRDERVGRELALVAAEKKMRRREFGRSSSSSNSNSSSRNSMVVSGKGGKGRIGTSTPLFPAHGGKRSVSRNDLTPSAMSLLRRANQQKISKSS
ncbi:hypothetical protein ScalyP_jg3772 [Parmales sp. scaly parma]|nr:hypothetical protein ScalyP_jg3772 [Parmales sp. scaly parma]